MEVIAIRERDKDTIYSFGEGEYIGDKVPDVKPFNEIDLPNPCIKLKSGELVWGFECWWGKKDKMEEKFLSEKNIKIILVKPNNIKIKQS